MSVLRDMKQLDLEDAIAATEPDACPTCGQPWPADKDGRANRNRLWRCRVRLYNLATPDEPEADSDPELEPGAAGTLLLRGLPEVADTLARMASEFHQQAPAGLGLGLLKHRLKGLRPTLSRRGGNAAWRVPYTVIQRDNEQAWLARVDIQRENAE